MRSAMDKSMMFLSSRVQLKYSSKTNCQRVAYVFALVEAQCKIYNMKAQHLSNVATIILSSLIFLYKSHVCACCVCLHAPETKHGIWLSTNTVRRRQIFNCDCTEVFVS